MPLEEEIFAFRARLLSELPFYGEILMKLPLVETRDVRTAATDGRQIFWNPGYMEKKTRGERNFILMHELFHVLLRHCTRCGDRDPQIWNIANDLIVNSMVSELSADFRRAGIEFQSPADGLYAAIRPDETSENLYQMILQDNGDRSGRKGRKWELRRRYTISGEKKTPADTIELSPSDVPEDLRPQALTPQEAEELNRALDALVRDALRNNPGSGSGSRFMDAVVALTGEKRLNWKQVMRGMLTDLQDGEASYATPERKYLHMDLILPGHGNTDPAIEEVWAFVDCSGSIANEQLKKFLLELYALVRTFRCTLHLVYWDTQVREVYRNLQSEKEVLESLPHSGGGTDINAVYRWLSGNKVRPDVMVILTDGDFGTLTDPGFRPQMKARTVLVLSERRRWTEDMKRIGKVVELK